MNRNSTAVWEPLTKAEIKRLYHCAHPESGALTCDVLFEGHKMLQEALRFPDRIKAVYSTEPIPGLELTDSVKYYLIDPKQAKTISHLEQFPGVACRLEICYADPVQAHECAVLLYGIQDPGNAGTMIRTSDWFGVPKVIVNNGVSLFNQKLVQATMGSILRVGVVKNDDLNRLAKSHHFYVSDLKGIPVEKLAVQQPWVLCIGNESRGTEGLDLEGATRVTIPGAGGNVDSLNASVSCGILLDRLRTATS